MFGESIYSTAIDDDVEHFTSVGLLPTTNTKKTNTTLAKCNMLLKFEQLCISVFLV